MGRVSSAAEADCSGAGASRTKTARRTGRLRAFSRGSGAPRLREMTRGAASRSTDVSRRAAPGRPLSRLGTREFSADAGEAGPAAQERRGLGRGPTRSKPSTSTRQAIDDTRHARSRRAHGSAALRSGRRVPETFAPANSTARPLLLAAKRLWAHRISGLDGSFPWKTSIFAFVQTAATVD